MTWMRPTRLSVTAAGLRGITLAFVFLLMASTGAVAQRATLVRGHVREGGSGNPIVAATVTVMDSTWKAVAAAMTNADGSFMLAVLDSGNYRLQTERLGYKTDVHPVKLSGDTVKVEVSMELAPLLLDQILVSVRRAGRHLQIGEQLVYGRLLDDSTHQAIPGGTIRLVTGAGQVAASTLSNDDGLFWLVSPKPGSYRLQGERIGYKSGVSPELKLMLGDSIGVNFYLSMQAVLLNPITVTASARPWTDRGSVVGMDEFFSRYRTFGPVGYGEFMTRDSIAKWEKRTTSVGDMLRDNMPEVLDVVPTSGLSPSTGADASGSFLGGAVVVRNGRFFGGVLQTRCIPTYYLDGVSVPYETVSAFQPQDLEGVELYVAPNVPSQFSAGFPCGVVVYWSRRTGGHHLVQPTYITGALVAVLLAVGVLLVH